VVCCWEVHHPKGGDEQPPFHHSGHGKTISASSEEDGGTVRKRQDMKVNGWVLLVVIAKQYWAANTSPCRTSSSSRVQKQRWDVYARRTLARHAYLSTWTTVKGERSKQVKVRVAWGMQSGSQAQASLPRANKKSSKQGLSSRHPRLGGIATKKLFELDKPLKLRAQTTLGHAYTVVRELG
jgi:hypothetical protein